MAEKVMVIPPKGTPDETVDLIMRCYKEKPDKKDLAELRRQAEQLTQKSETNPV